MSFFLHFLFLLTSKRSLSTNILYNIQNSEVAFQHQPSAIELGLVKHILQRAKAKSTRAIFHLRSQCNFQKLLHCCCEEKIAHVACLTLVLQHLLKSC